MGSSSTSFNTTFFIIDVALLEFADDMAKHADVSMDLGNRHCLFCDWMNFVSVFSKMRGRWIVKVFDNLINH